MLSEVLQMLMQTTLTWDLLHVSEQNLTSFIKSNLKALRFNLNS